MTCAMIRIEVGSPAEGFDLRESLARRGIHAVLVAGGEGCEVEVSSPREAPDRLFHDVAEGIESWLAGRGREQLVVCVDGQQRTVTAPRVAAPA
jgi:hypothetical protein